MKLVSVEEMVAIEKQANAAGLSYDQMMQNAGRGLAQAVAEYYEYLEDAGVLGLVGSGNNGGDTLVALRHLADMGWEANAYLVRSRPDDDPLIDALEEAGGEIVRIDDDPDYERLLEMVATHGVMLDGVLGTGIQLPLRGQVAEALQAVKHALGEMDEPPDVVAVDCPSGVDCDSGEAAPEALSADLTVTMAAIKTGLLKFPAYKLVGGLQLVGIGLPEEGEALEAWRAVKRQVVTADDVAQLLPERPLDSHKGTFGTALVVAGSTNFTGAALLAGEAAYRIGAGLVTLGVVAPVHMALAGQRPEVTWVILPNEMGVIAPAAADVVRENLERAKALLIGPGFGTEDPTEAFLARLLKPESPPGRGAIGFIRQPQKESETKNSELPPMLVDADGLKLLCRIPDWHTYLPANTVLTPHPGEMAIMSGLSIDEIQADRSGVAQRFSQEWGHVLVLKGAFTVIAAPDGRQSVIPVASPALARAGTGDVLSGIIVGLMAQGLEAYQAAQVGAWIHAQAGLAAAEEMGNTASVLAGDVVASIGSVLRNLL